MSIKAEHINFLYGQGTAFEQYALKDVSFQIQDGEFIGLIGHTGSGKSTLIQHLNGLLRATSGAIYYNGENIYQEGYDMKALRSRVGLVFQYPEHQLFEIDVFSDVCFGPKNQGLDPEETLLFASGVARLALQHPHTINPGVSIQAAWDEVEKGRLRAELFHPSLPYQ